MNDIAQDNGAQADMILEERRGAVAILTLNRPHARNALSGALVRQLLERFASLDADEGVNCLVLTGSDPVFCAGADLREITASGIIESAERVELSLALHQALPALGKPVIAAVNGHALAGGCGLALACDLVIASDEADFGYPEVPRGLVAALVMVKLGRLVSQRKAIELLFSGRRVPASEAVSLGMINEAVPKSGVMARALEWADELAGRSPLALRLTKELFYESLDLAFVPALRRARDTNLIMRRSKDALRGAASFFDRPQEGNRQ